MPTINLKLALGTTFFMALLTLKQYTMYRYRAFFAEIGSILNKAEINPQL